MMFIFFTIYFVLKGLNDFGLDNPLVDALS